MTPEQIAVVFNHRKAFMWTWARIMYRAYVQKSLEPASETAITLYDVAYARSDAAARAVYEVAPSGTKIAPEVRIWTN